ncbi:pantothenate synthetase [Macrolepiota fuliginosa MF-IS2]|uniref:Pantoate--beta-alanine ligase n=1 Tax=Macrolepiota fuliginosa MF-IS2 TaxID=1400762 RepID=A0A9P5XB05_9AGAR|nr:pantothenate synthetase [Macrolepiota fuliginosa MF-IS2]
MPPDLPPSSIPLLTTAAAFREWREIARREQKTVGYVPTMGALHEGHLSLVRRSLAENDLTVLSIFVNPAQFAPHEDLATYPRTLEHDIVALAPVSFSSFNHTNGTVHPGPIIRQPSAIFLPNAKEIYPSGITQDVSAQKGTFVEVKGYSHQMEGKSRPTFFRGVATVVTKLFNVIQPTRAYFGQKDIQQALLLKRLAQDLLMSYPLPENVCIVPTARDETDGLALSSRNAYLSLDGRKVASTLYQALSAARLAWEEGATKAECLAKAYEVVETRMKEAQENQLDVDMSLDFIEFNDADTFEVVPDNTTMKDLDVVLLSGALFVGKTRLIDNLVLGDDTKIIG